MILNGTLMHLEAVLAGAVAANQPEAIVDYIEYNPQAMATPPAQVRTALNGNTDVTILAAPTINPTREPIRVSIYNKDTASVTVTVKTDDGTTERIACKVTLLTLETLHFEKAHGWYATDANGNVKGTNGGIPVTIIDAAGDLIVGTAADVAARLAIGTARQVLRVNAGATAPVWDAQITLAAEQASTSGTSIDFTGIPVGAKRITIMLAGVSTNGTSPLVVKVGDSGGIETGGYTGTCADVLAAGNTLTNTPSTEWTICNTVGAGATYAGQLIMNLEDSANNDWSFSCTISQSGGVAVSSGLFSNASGAIDRVRITTAGGVNTFDAGAINISYE